MPRRYNGTLFKPGARVFVQQESGSDFREGTVVKTIRGGAVVDVRFGNGSVQRRHASMISATLPILGIPVTVRG